MNEETSVQKGAYELGFHIHPSLEGEQLNKKLDALKNEISSREGLITKFRETKRIHLAYPIKKNTSAHFGTVEFIGPRTIVASLCDAFKLDNDILRYIVVKKEETKAKPKKEFVPKPTPRKEPEKTPEKPDIEPKEIEKQLEEILGNL